jgi:hypothetical protein
MTKKAYTRLDLAKKQLEGAIVLFASGNDLYSAITLAGAADVILSRLVSNKGDDNFTVFSMKEHDAPQGSSPEEYGKAMNDTLHINDMKHMDKGEDGFVELDPYECALGAILKACANLKTLVGPDDLVIGFVEWVKINVDPRKFNISGDPDWKPQADAADNAPRAT